MARLPPSAQAVADFLARIPKQHLAQAASRCGAHARALQDYESYVRSAQGGGLNPSAHKSDVIYQSSQVSFLLEVYGQLEEPDGLAGLMHLRHGGLTPMDQVIAAEKAGSWSEALALYEQLLSTQEGSEHGEPDGPLKRSGSLGAKRATNGAAAVASQRAPGLVGGRLNMPTPVDVSVTAGGASSRGEVGSWAPNGALSALQHGALRCLLQTGHLQALLRQPSNTGLKN
ncbi:hypothetical protein DUNSADRAFT_10383 [Dunaliella salina]|uniref:non-specific serine/threonine protein kinase n=1 Tax=Dunaliella salina TaxID=3046 RepID=A0ABQ7GFF5_DUNSA|nr:hypothetical protein DUNSADRAFT_10383 [Dunaliella salina]|eukprot:KAF5833342.1 hypothetical protein DUNSADRAFT_10383 [Dunaliella salina]